MSSNSGRHAILCLFADPSRFEERLKEPGSPLAILHATLKLWGEAYVRCADASELLARMDAASARQEEALVVVEGVNGDLLAYARGLATRPRVIVVTTDAMRHGPEDLEATRDVHHFLSLNQQGHLAKTALISAVKKWTTRDVFGVEKYLGYGTPIHSFTVSRSDERAWFVDTLTDFVSGLDGVIPSGAPDFARMAGEVLDELLMNAIWDANPARARRGRDQPVFLKPTELVRLEWGVDGNILAVSVTDPFGSLDEPSLQEYRHEVLDVPRVGAVKVNTEGPGAGIGLHMVIRRVSGLVINMNPGVATEFVALLDVTSSPRYLAKGPKTFHFFSV
jgi:hypothetical protein